MERPNSKSAQARYSATPRRSSFLFSLISIICPAYKERDTAGITSDKPINPMAKGSLVNSYTHHPTKVPIIRNPIINKNLPIMRFLYSEIRIAAKGSFICWLSFICRISQAFSFIMTILFIDRPALVRQFSVLFIYGKLK